MFGEGLVEGLVERGEVWEWFGYFGRFLDKICEFG